ncbi:flagellar hook-length control protein FliK [Frigidibacter sp.]|uniref:flagellar hook-length control protein FliK n=1 Tax=Frigidibacter sp. TaxID=2586418 RepID=UPI00273553F1|nr:flagellar hook-length control protein FliK [Frigidibacter sp.]MDP3341304.1 flagellar hook-length control protein FliK [Frigidibacter sp.]
MPALGPQLAEAVARFPDRPVELTLSPEELGRVRLTLSTSDAGLVLAVSAERPETLDLMRRNIDQLARDFREIGFSDLSFSFTQQDRRPQAGPHSALPDASAPAEAAAPAALPTAPAPRRPAPAGGLDLRI